MGGIIPLYIGVDRMTFWLGTTIPIIVEIIKLSVLIIIKHKKGELPLTATLGAEVVRFFILLVLLFTIIKPQTQGSEAASIMFCISFFVMLIVATIGNKTLVKK